MISEIQGMPAEDWVSGRIVKSIVRSLVEELSEREWEPDKVYVTDIVYGCPRRAWFNRRFGPAFMDLDALLRTWVGRKLHETQVLEMSEVELEWEGIKGRIDEYEKGILVEKKFTWSPPSGGARDHHQQQVQFYRVLLEENGYPVEGAFIVYFDLQGGARPRVYQVPLRRMDEVKAVMRARRDELLPHLSGNDPPPERPGWWCKYCPFVFLCHSEWPRVKLWPGEL